MQVLWGLRPAAHAVETHAPDFQGPQVPASAHPPACIRWPRRLCRSQRRHARGCEAGMCLGRSESTSIRSFTHSLMAHGAWAPATGSDAGAGTRNYASGHPHRACPHGACRESRASACPAAAAHQPVPARGTATSTQGPGRQQAPGAVSRATHGLTPFGWAEIVQKPLQSGELKHCNEYGGTQTRAF